MDELDPNVVYEKARQLGSSRHLHDAARMIVNEIAGATMVYTLPVIDDDGSITGKRGRVLVQSRGVVLRGALDDVAVGEAIEHIEGALVGHRWWVLPDGRRFEEIAVSGEPNPRGELPVAVRIVWRRVE